MCYPKPGLFNAYPSLPDTGAAGDGAAAPRLRDPLCLPGHQQQRLSRAAVQRRLTSAAILQRLTGCRLQGQTGAEIGGQLGL